MCGKLAPHADVVDTTKLLTPCLLERCGSCTALIKTRAAEPIANFEYFVKRMRVRVRVAWEERTIVVELTDGATVAELRQSIFDHEDELSPLKHRLRFLFSGKLLDIPTATLSSMGMRDGEIVICAVSEVPQGDQCRPDDPPARASPQVQSVSALRNAGFTDEQILALRFPFMVRAPDDSSSELRVDLDELDANERGDVPPMLDTLDAEEGTMHDWWWGFMLGALLGIIMLILSMDRSLALSRRWRRGISIGVAFNLLFGLLMLLNDKTVSARF